MAPELSRLFSRHLRSQSHDLFARKDALLIGPGGEVVAAYGAGNLMPAIPEVVTGRLQQYTAADSPQATGVASPLTGTPTQGPTAIVTAATFLPTSAAPNSATVASLSSTSAITLLSASVTGSSGPTASPSSSPPTSTVAPSSSLSSSSLSSLSASSSSISSTLSITSGSSSSVPSTTTSSATATAASAPGSRDHRQLYLGIALASIFAGAIIVALLAYFYRICSRSRRHRRRARMLWPWDRKNRDMENGLAAGGAYDYGRFGASNEEPKERKDRVDGELPDPRYTGRSYAEHQLAHGLYDIPITASPFRPVPLPHMTTIPDLAPELGLLQVANYVPGDISSDDGSRSNSRQGAVADAAPQPAGASPAVEEWSVYGPDDGFRNPWSPLRVRSREGLGIVEGDITDAPAEHEDQKSGEAASAPAPPDGWAASLRSNLAHAFQAVVGSTSRASLVSTSRAPEEQDSQAAPPDNPFDDPALPSVVPPDPEQDDPAPRCTQCLSPTDDAVLAPSEGTPRCLCEWLAQKQLPLPPSMQAHAHAHLAVPAPTPGAAPSPAPAPPSPRSRCSSPAGSPRFGLPLIPTSRRGSQSSLQQALDRRRLARARSRKLTLAAPRTPRTPRPAATPLVRAGSTCTVGSDMSRCASTEPGALTDQEQYAVWVLRERRRRVVDSQRLAARRSLSRPSVRSGSKRKGKGSGEEAGSQVPVAESAL